MKASIYIRFIGILGMISLLTFVSCDSMRSPNVTGSHANFTLPNGFVEFTDYTYPNAYNPCRKITTCTSRFPVENEPDTGCLKVIRNNVSLVNLFGNDAPTNIDFSTHYIADVQMVTDYCSGFEQSTFIGINEGKKQIFIRVQFELYDQAAGSGIGSACVGTSLIIPIKYEDYKIIATGKCMNPF